MGLVWRQIASSEANTVSTVSTVAIADSDQSSRIQSRHGISVVYTAYFQLTQYHARFQPILLLIHLDSLF